MRSVHKINSFANAGRKLACETFSKEIATTLAHTAVRTFILTGDSDDDNLKLLLLKRARGRKLAGQEEPPGGKIEHYEDPKLAAQREIMEECGHLVPDHELKYLGCRYFPAREGGTGAEFFFATHQKKRPVTLSQSEHESFKWTAVDELVDSLEGSSLCPRVHGFFLENLERIKRQAAQMACLS